jgi:sugar diacid utilization regulator/GAF domain-containing protein
MRALAATRYRGRAVNFDAVGAGMRRSKPADESASLSAYRRAVRAFAEVAGALTAARDSDTLLRLIGRHLCELVGITRCSVYLREPDSALFRGQVGWSRDWRDSSYEETDARIKRLVAGTHADVFTREIVDTRRPVLVADAESDPRPIHSTMRGWGVRSMLGVPMVLGGEVIGIVFLDDADHRHEFTPAESEIASIFADLAAVVISQAEMTVRLRRSLDTVAKQNELLQHAAEMDEILTSLVLVGGNLAEIVTAVAELTGKPCEIYDAEHRRLAVGLPPGHAGEPAWRSLDRAARSHPGVRAALDALGQKGSGVIGPLPEADLQHRYLISPIVTRDETWGSLAIVEYGREFGALDAHIGRRAATNVALELVAERRAANAEWDARSSLAGDLIRGTTDEIAVTRRAEYLGVDLHAPHVVCIVGAQGSGMPPSVADVAGAFAARASGRSVLAVPMAEGIVVIVRVESAGVGAGAGAGAGGELARAARRTAEQVVEELGEDAALLVAVGPCCSSVDCYVRAYEEARQVMSCLQTFAEGERSVVLSTDDLGPGRLFLASSTPQEADRFVRDALGALVTSNDAALADVLGTLEVFFESSRSVRRAAQRLGVHENTIRYRLARIKQLTGLAIGSDANDELTAHLALLILRMQRLARGRVPADTPI